MKEILWRRFTRASWQLLIPAILGCVLGADGMWAGALAALGPGMGRGAARARKARSSQTQGALVEGLASCVLGGLVAAVSAVVGFPSVFFWTAWTGFRALQLASPPKRINFSM